VFGEDLADTDIGAPLTHGINLLRDYIQYTTYRRYQGSIWGEYLISREPKKALDIRVVESR
jgi:hypothetical protein